MRKGRRVARLPLPPPSSPVTFDVPRPTFFVRLSRRFDADRSIFYFSFLSLSVRRSFSLSRSAYLGERETVIGAFVRRSVAAPFLFVAMIFLRG